MIIKENIKQAIAQPGDVANILVALIGAEDKISREREHFWVIDHVIIGEGQFFSFSNKGLL